MENVEPEEVPPARKPVTTPALELKVQLEGGEALYSLMLNPEGAGLEVGTKVGSWALEALVVGHELLDQAIQTTEKQLLGEMVSLGRVQRKLRAKQKTELEAAQIELMKLQAVDGKGGPN